MAFTKEEIWGCRLVRDQVLVACRRAAELAFDEAGDDVRYVRDFFLCESPIEAVFHSWWAVISRTVNRDSAGPYGWEIRAQQDVVVDGTAYRVDFELVPDVEGFYESLRQDGFSRPRVAIEVDGHDFHERTKEQVAHRNARDRALQQAGWRVLHFSGSEIVRDPESAVRAVFECGAGIWRSAYAFMAARPLAIGAESPGEGAIDS